VKSFVVQNFLKNGARWLIVVHDIAINGEAAGSCFLREMKESQHIAIRFTVNLQIVETVATWCKPSTLEPGIGT
jgi:hypothetical protein